MGSAPQPPNQISDYLLGRLSEAEKERLEEKYFTDNDAFIELLETEDRLIKDYLLDKLSPPERLLFEKNYMTTPCKRQKVEFAHLLNQPEARELVAGRSRAAARNSPSLHESIFSFLRSRQIALLPLTAAAAILIGVLVWGVKKYIFTPPSSEVAGISAPAPSISSINISLDIVPGSQRSSGAQSLPTAVIGSGERQVELKLKLAGYVYPKYQGHLRKIDDGIKEIESNDSLKPEKIRNETIVRWKVEAARLPVGDYLVELQGVKAGGDLGDTITYDFNVRSREGR